MPYRLALFAVSFLPAVAMGMTVRYEVDPAHTYPSFEADHMGGLSTWRGKFNATRGEVSLDRAAGTGSVTIEVDIASIDFGHDEMNRHAIAADLFDAADHPRANYTGTLAGFRDGAPTRVEGKLTLRGVMHPLALDIVSFKCMPHPMLKREVCGADARAVLQRDAFGISAGKDHGFDMRVALRIQVEAVQVASAPAVRAD
ncbi:MAG: polyisoprenoid-binding protein [Xanthomonadales bacterium]|nr:polyisoprenoid-binding protein [Xanthomonadales bacterium]